MKAQFTDVQVNPAQGEGPSRQQVIQTAADQGFSVLATQNPLEMEGTYPLPEAQLDRFLLKLHVRDDLHSILERTTSEVPPRVEPVVTQERVLEISGSCGVSRWLVTFRTMPSSCFRRPTPIIAPRRRW